MKAIIGGALQMVRCNEQSQKSSLVFKQTKLCECSLSSQVASEARLMGFNRFGLVTLVCKNIKDDYG